MNLSELASGVIRDTERLKDHNRLVLEYQNYEQLKTEFDRLLLRILRTSRSVSLLRDDGIEVRTTPAPPDAVRKLRALVADDGAFSDNPLADATPALRALRDWVEDQNTKVSNAYRTWVNQLFGDLEGIKRFAEHVAAFDNSKAIRITGLVHKARAKLASPPDGPVELEETRLLAQEISTEVESIASTDVQRGYLAALRTDGIALENLTEDFEAWAREKRIWPSLRVKLG